MDLTQRAQLTNLLITFFSYTEPAHEDFSSAVDDFKQRVPDLARGLVQIIQDAHATNAAFQKAFKSFFTVCKESLNPNLSEAAVDEMLVTAPFDRAADSDDLRQSGFHSPQCDCA